MRESEEERVRESEGEGGRRESEIDVYREIEGGRRERVREGEIGERVREQE